VQLLHGEAVAIGMIGAGLIEIEFGIGDADRLARVRAMLEKLDVPTSIPKQLSKEQLIELIKRDKKAVNKWPKFVLVDRIGQVYCPEGQYAVEVRQEVVENVIGKLY